MLPQIGRASNKTELAVPHIVFRHQLQDMPEDRLRGAARVLVEVMRGEMLAHHVAGEQSRGLVMLQPQIAGGAR